MRLLVAEDDPVFRRMIADLAVEWGYEVESARDGDEAWELLRREDPPPLCLLDWVMPGVDGLELCQRLRRLHGPHYVYVVILTGRTERPDVVRALAAGADDFLRKPVDAEELMVRLKAGRRVMELQRLLEEQASHDGLTGLWNRTTILATLERERARAVREEGGLALVLADLDHFKDVNDVHGHQAGDSVLREAAIRMAAGLREYDSLGRFGGEEFLAVLPGCDEATAASVAERMRHLVASGPVATAGGEVEITTSLGVAAMAPGESFAPDELLRRVDKALYGAKEKGRDRVERASATPTRAFPAVSR